MTSPLAPLSDERLSRRGVRVLLKRDDLIHPEISGNKARKLKYNIRAAAEFGHHTLLTFGGAYSNHLRATAAAGFHAGFRTVGVVRGEEHLPLNASLAYATARGMQLTYLDRTTYRAKHSPDVIASLESRFGDFYLLPEGGSNTAAVLGCAELPGEIDEPFDVICCPVGTGGTLAGIAGGLRDHQRAIGFAALRGGAHLDHEAERLQSETYGGRTGNWTIESAFHCGGFAKRTSSLDHFIADFTRRHGIDLDWVYVAKMMLGLFSLIEQGSFPRGTLIVAVVTGGSAIPELD